MSPALSFFFFFNDTATTEIYTLSLHDALPIFNIHITIIELNALHTKRQNLFQELDAVIHLLMEAILDRKSGSAGMPRPISYAVFCLKKKKKNVETLIHNTTDHCDSYVVIRLLS